MSKTFGLWVLRLTVVGALALVPPVFAEEVLRVLTWPGYADADLVKAFEKQFNARVEVTFVSTDDVLRERLGANQGRDFDVVAANTAEISSFIDRKLLLPLRMERIPNTQRQLPRFRDLQRIGGILRPEGVYAVPYTFSEMGLIYDRKQVAQAPTSMAAMWDPQYKGRVLAFDGSTHAFSIASLLLHGKPFRIEDRQCKWVVAHLIALRRNVLSFYRLPEESVELFRRNRVALLFANYGNQQVKLLRDAGPDVGYVIPSEGALAWLDCWAVSRGVRNQSLAESWINYTLEPQVSGALTKRQGLSNTIEASPLTQDSDKLIWLEPAEDDKRRASLWARITSGDTPGRF
ncbi:MAG: extracellular solute-binding protein [Rhodoferax sp.]|nr:extracellular solute-binding protein [Rhodoferax sp.]